MANNKILPTFVGFLLLRNRLTPNVHKPPKIKESKIKNVVSTKFIWPSINP